jgi:putative hydrolase of the HAD superfamily
MVKAILFDLDGTLLDRDASLLRLIHDQYDRFHAAFGHIPQDTFIKRFVELDAHGYVWKDKVYQLLIEEFGICGVSWDELLDDYLARFHEHCVPFPHLHATLEQLTLRQIKLGMITNGFTALQMSNIRALEIEHDFSVLLISEQAGLRKPDPRIFQKALDELGVSAQESMYVGDHPANDILAAQQVGMLGVWKRNDCWPPPAEADFVIDDLSELLSLIQPFSNKL